jgi:hypothetical protein
VAEGELLLLTSWHLVLTGLPAIAAALYAARRGVGSVPILLAIALVASGAVGLLGFWSYYADPLLGETLSFFVVLGSSLAIGWLLATGGIDQGLLRELGVPLALWVFASLFLVMLGFVHGGENLPLEAGKIRFIGPLPSDSEIPNFFAEWFYEHGHDGTLPIFPGEWSFSDRPPLQTGYVLSQRALGWDGQGLNYQLLGVVLQQLWVVGLWALLLAARVGRTTRVLILVTVLISPLVLVNGFFVWPKLLPTAFLLAATALVVTPLWDQVRRHAWGAALVAALCGLAMLGHGSSIFGVIPLVVIAAFRGLPNLRWITVGLAVGAVLLAPWSAFQKWEDPPGNRLMKWTLAGSVEIDDRGTLETISDSYSEVGLDGAIDYKLANYKLMTGWNFFPTLIDEAADTGSLKNVIRAVQSGFFLFLFPSLGLLLLAPFAMALAAARRLKREQSEWKFALVSFAVFLVGILAWGLLVFGDADIQTSVHVGTYLLPVLAMACAVAGLRAAFPRFSLFYVGFWVALVLAAYAPSYLWVPETSYSPLAAILAAAALAAFLAVAIRGLPLRTQEK